VFTRTVIISVFVTAFMLAFEACAAWVCASVARVGKATLLRSFRLLVFELLIPLPVAGVIGYAVGCTVGGTAGVQAGLLCAFGFSLYLFLAIARSVYETSYARAGLFSAMFVAMNLVVFFAASYSPTVTSVTEAIISWHR
jgi:hypothetical protein